VYEAIDIILDMLFKTSSPPPVPFNSSQLKLLKFAVCYVPFQFLHKNDVQFNRIAMGSPLGPILADIFISNLEIKLNKL
jgi:hypothetical protein